MKVRGTLRLLDVRRLAQSAAVAFCVALGSGHAAAQEIKPGGTMIVALPGDPEVFNSGISTDISSSNISGQVYSTIVRLDNDGNVQPSLAKSWEMSPDGLTYTFHFFDDIKWHDGRAVHGRGRRLEPVEHQQEVQRPGRPACSRRSSSITATDDRDGGVQAEISLSAAAASGLAYFNSSTILPKHIFDNGTDPRQNPANFKPIGTGPFVFKEYRKGSHVALEKNPELPSARASPISTGWCSRSSRTRRRARWRWRRARSTSSRTTRCRSPRWSG